MTLLLALMTTAAAAQASRTTIYEIDACEGGINKIHVRGCAYDPEAYDVTLPLWVYIDIFTDDYCLYQYGQRHSIQTDVLREDWNETFGITGNHGFDVNIPIADAGTYYVKIYVQELNYFESTLANAPNTQVIVRNPELVTLSGQQSYTAKEGDILTGSTSGTVTIADGASITLSDATINGGIICAGSATITLVGENSVTGKTISTDLPDYYNPLLDGPVKYDNTAGIQVGGQRTTLTIRGDGALTATGGAYCAGIGLPFGGFGVEEINGGDIVIEGGDITAIGDNRSAGIGTGAHINVDTYLGQIIIKGGRVKATGGCGIGSCSTPLGSLLADPWTVFFAGLTIYDDIDVIETSNYDLELVCYMHGTTDVSDNVNDFFMFGNNSNTVTIMPKISGLDDSMHYTVPSNIDVPTITYHKTLGEDRVGKHQAWLVPFDYTITEADTLTFKFYKIHMIANSPSPSVDAADEVWVFLTRLYAWDVLRANMPYVYKPLTAVTDYEFTTPNATLKAKNTGILLDTSTTEDIYSFYATYENTTATTADPFYYVGIDGNVSYGDAVTVGPFRWIIRKTSKFAGTPAYARRMYFYDDETTGIDPIDNGELTIDNEAGAWYSIDGRPLNGKPTAAGLYIVGGRKVIIK